ncbi:M56 family metallopeptidase [Desulfosporosinus sp. BG]|uniref:M56 family metallopeptidase n=1 Tax=Desulfosporosinus sp. BG TaxID=1633135 RepID=UPI00083A5950|nr:M56 family metallopeptidase [Desulfosporosinus sp. BG]ODA42561.1 Regulatory sensor-transducer, BlaR1/MecR1 family [Desulfosporosinus sp. BG]
MLNNIFLVSLTMSAVIVLLLIISPFLHKRYSAKWCYIVWLVLALRLVFPWRFELPQAPVHLPSPSDQTIILKQDGMPGLIMGDSHLEKGDNPFAPVSASSPSASSAAVNESASAGYIPVINLQELLLVVWALGAMSFFLFHIISYIKFRRKTKPYCRETDRTVLDSVLNSMKIKSRPQLFRCSKIASPMLTGFFQAAILLPDVDYTWEELSVVLQHEVIHYKRGDIWYKLLLLTANSVHWFNPFVYFMIKAANRDLEYSCDDIVVRNSDLNFRKEYSLTILKSMQNSRTTTLHI